MDGEKERGRERGREGRERELQIINEESVCVFNCN